MKTLIDSHKKSGFTLVEMLVVIAIIALLASLITPAVGRALEKGKAARCASNLKQIGATFLGYANENRGHIPAVEVPYSMVNFTRKQFPDRVQYWSDRYLLGETLGNLSNGGAMTPGSTLRCPSDVQPYNGSGSQLQPSYGLNVVLYTRKERPVYNALEWRVNYFIPDSYSTMLEFPQPSITLLAIDAHDVRFNPGWVKNSPEGFIPRCYSAVEPYSGQWNSGTPTSNYNWVVRHRDNRSANAVFLDGHVRSISNMRKEAEDGAIVFR